MLYFSNTLFVFSFFFYTSLVLVLFCVLDEADHTRLFGPHKTLLSYRIVSYTSATQSSVASQSEPVHTTHQTVLEMRQLVFIHLHLGFKTLLGVLQSVGVHRSALESIIHYLHSLTHLLQFSLGARQLSAHYKQHFIQVEVNSVDTNSVWGKLGST